ncbi:hypothetical protein CDA63_18365 [Hymenobacter amundsenii]|uniref:DUF2846 domain-containing protein n=1 Tax=Hymenobacter amundsenii TaxID=2006685 RepID=A0A246FGK4_9BACT|nr:hypothetical protein [Hymenobacter amundsenii]OWP61656.1 hypothetical protein CDA63_18365 [Hymenobacter amundsenii]
MKDLPFAPTCALLMGSFLITSCSSASTEENACTAPTHEVHLYTTNRSEQDTLAPVRLVIDDSLVFAQVIPRHIISDEWFARMVRLCEGTHRLHVEFGRYARDTTFVVRENISLLASMRYDTTSFVIKESGLRLPPDLRENGVHVVTLVRDGDTSGRAVK